MTRDLEAIKEPENEFTHEMNLEKELLKDNINNDLDELFARDADPDETEEIEEVTEEVEEVAEEDNDEEEEDNPKVKEVDKSFYSNSLTFNKSDFDGFEDLENGVKRSSTLTKVAIFFIVLLLLGTIFLILNFVLGWNIL